MEDIKNKFKSMAVVMLMLVSVIAVSTVVTSTTVTNNGAAESSPVPGASYVGALDFTLTDDGTDTLLNGTLPAVGTILSDSDEATDWGANDVTGNLSYFDKTNGDVWDPDNDCIFNDTNENSAWNTGEPIIAGNQSMTDGEAITGVGVRDTNWVGIATYDAVDGDPWDSSVDAIIFEDDNNNCYGDSLNDVDVVNDGTLDITLHVDLFSLWAEDGTTAGFQWDEDTHIADNVSGNIDLFTDAYYPITDAGQRFYLSANISGTAYPGESLEMQIVFDGSTLNSTDTPATITNPNAQSVGKLGVDYFEGNYSGPTDIITNDPDTIAYGNTVNLRVDTSMLESTGAYYLYRPYYIRSGSIPGAYTYELRWIPVTAGGSVVYITSDQSNVKTFSNIDLDYAGMWVITNVDPGDIVASGGVEEDYAYFWVNNTSPYTIEISNDDIFYGNNESITITVTEEGTSAPTWIDIRDEDDNLVLHSWEPDGTVSLIGDWTNFTAAGNYTVSAYYDEDETMIGYGIYGYSGEYGYTNPAITGTNYSAYSGPWDPYEKNASSQTIRVRTGVPDAMAQSGNDTMYWGFDGEVNITIKGYDGENLTGDNADLHVSVYNDDDQNVTSYLDSVNDPNTIGDGYILISDSNWGVDSKAAGLNSDNGTWYVLIYKNIDGDDGADEYTEEWNVTVEFEVSKPPKGQFKWIDDDGTPFTDDNNDGVIPRIPTLAEVPLIIKFEVYDEDSNDFGSLASGECNSILECAENISITGDSLFTGSVDTLPGYTDDFYNAGTWEIPIIPTMSAGGGEITFEVNAFNTTLTRTLSIGGTDYEAHGSVVQVTPNDFMIDQENQTLTVTVTNSETGTTNPYCYVYLYYMNDTGVPVIQEGAASTEYVAYATATGGEYTMAFNITQQTDNQTYIDFDGDGSLTDTEIMAPRNLTIYVDGPGDRDGYALVHMTRVNDLEMELSHNTILAGMQYDDFYLNCTIAGNSTDTPSSADRGDFHIKIIDEDGDDVTDTLLNGIDSNDLTNDADYIFEFNNVYATEPGTYTVYAYNNTHDSTGFNATLVVEQVTVTCDKTPFVWGSDDNISATFTITYNGNPINGSLVIDNMTRVSPAEGDDYNGTWYNTSFDGTTDQGGNISIEIDEDDIVNGVVTIHDITADYLAPDEAQQNITFWFRPESDGGVGAFAQTLGMVPVSVPTITPEQIYVAVGQTTTLDITVTGRGQPLDDVYVGLHGRGVEQNGTSGSDGIVTFSVLPTSSGNISIDVGEEGRTIEDVLVATNWRLDVSVSPIDVDEGEDFTVTVTLEADGEPVDGATVRIQGISTMTTGTDGEATFTAPEVSSDRTYTISVSKAGYAPEPDQVTVRVINIPRLVISADAEVAPGETFDIVIAKDTGDPVIGATVTFNDKTYSTKAGGVAQLTAPSETGDYTITASFGTFEDATKTIKVTEDAAEGIPGFELLTLVAALGVAFILLRRRRQ